MSDFIIWLLLIFTIMIIVGLYISEFTPINLSEKDKILREGFSPIFSKSSDQTEGASELYDWGVPEDVTVPEQCPHKYNNTCPATPPPQTCSSPSPPPVRPSQNCGVCDITLNKDIDKYVLKSSVPACPDMSEYITKNMMNANPDLKDYILKSEIKPCEKVDISQYILKSEIPACPVCPICPECPICPVCPPEKECKEIYNYKISDHPDFKNYVSKNDLKKKYVLKNEYLEEEEAIIYKSSYKPSCKNGNNFPKNNNLSNSKNLESVINFISIEPDGYYAGDSLFSSV